MSSTESSGKPCSGTECNQFSNKHGTLRVQLSDVSRFAHEFVSRRPFHYLSCFRRTLKLQFSCLLNYTRRSPTRAIVAASAWRPTLRSGYFLINCDNKFTDILFGNSVRSKEMAAMLSWNCRSTFISFVTRKQFRRAMFNLPLNPMPLPWDSVAFRYLPGAKMHIEPTWRGF